MRSSWLAVLAMASVSAAGHGMLDTLLEEPPLLAALNASFSSSYLAPTALARGTQLELSLTLGAPSLRFGDASPLARYTVLLVDGDAPPPFVQHAGHAMRHWAIVNVPGSSLVSGESGVEGGTILSSYLPPRPPRGSGAHRYCLVALLQPADELRLDDELVRGLQTHESRYDWGLTQFANAHHLQPVAATFFRASHARASRLAVKPLDVPSPPSRDSLLGIVACMAIVAGSVGVLVMRFSQPALGRWREHRDAWPSARSCKSLVGLGGGPSELSLSLCPRDLSATAAAHAAARVDSGIARAPDERLLPLPALGHERPGAADGLRDGRTPGRSVSLVFNV
jgi:phosphatidylethanolamine-binding protein (PEBP) family uncharacterized protein